ncbi:MAG: hypothetical protein WCE79_09685 [Xanthobacteraceae bacterium]
MAYETAAYIVEEGGPAALEKHVEDIQQSGLTIVILGMLHIGWSDPKFPKMKLGDLIYNNYPGWFPDKRGNLLVSEGKFNPTDDPEIAKWPAQVARLKQNSKVHKVLLSLGGAGPPDFTHIQKDLDFGRDPRFTQNIKALKQAVPALDGIDFDCEEGGIELGTFVGLGQLFKDLGLEITFCPYMEPQLWQERMQAMKGGLINVSCWNLQCYAGGGGNRRDLSDWLAALANVVGPHDAPRYLVPGLAVKSATDTFPERDRFCPSQVESTVAGWKDPELGGVFLWTYDALKPSNSGDCGGTNKLVNYIEAIKQGMNSA